MTKRKGIIDRIEGKWVVVEFDDGMRDIQISRFPMTVESGDVIWMDECGSYREGWKEYNRISQEIDSLMEELWEDWFNQWDMRKILIKLVWSWGGGGKGAYQIGVWEALKAYRLDERIAAISGTSVEHWMEYWLHLERLKKQRNLVYDIT